MFCRLFLPLQATYLIVLLIPSITMITWSAPGDPLDLYQTSDTRLSLKNGMLDSKKSRAMANWGKSAMIMVTILPTCQRKQKTFFFLFRRQIEYKVPYIIMQTTFSYISWVFNSIIYVEISFIITVRKKNATCKFSTYFFNKDISFNIICTLMKFHLPILECVMQGTGSQIFI